MLDHKQKSCTYRKVKVSKCMKILPNGYTKVLILIIQTGSPKTNNLQPGLVAYLATTDAGIIRYFTLDTKEVLFFNVMGTYPLDALEIHCVIQSFAATGGHRASEMQLVQI